MQRNEPERRQGLRKTAERDASKPGNPQARPDEEEDEAPEKPENAPSFLTARELQARDPGKNEEREKPQPGQKRGGD